MSERNRVPQKASDFNGYIIATEARLVATNPSTSNPFWQDFNLSSAEQTYWTNQKTAWIALYPQYTNPATVNKSIRLQVETFMKNFASNARPLLNKIAASGMVDQDSELIFNVDLEQADPTFHTMPIAVSCYAEIKHKGGGVVDIKCRAENDSSRPSIPTTEGANAVQYAYRIGAPGGSEFDPDNAGVTINFSTKSHFELNAGATARGQWLYIYFRWINTHHPALAGAWSEMYSVVVA